MHPTSVRFITFERNKGLKKKKKKEVKNTKTPILEKNYRRGGSRTDGCTGVILLEGGKSAVAAMIYRTKTNGENILAEFER